MSGGTASGVEESRHPESYYQELWSRLSNGRRLPRGELARWREIERLLARLEGPEREESGALATPRRALDLGCGRGWITRLIADRWPSSEVRGIDPLAASVDVAKGLHPDLDFRRATGRELLLAGEAGTYDVIVASEVIEHVPHPEQSAFLTEASQLLRVGGHLILTTPRRELWRRWYRSGREIQPIEAWLTEAQVTEHVQRAGFDILTRSRVHPPNRPLVWQGWLDKWLLGRRWVRSLPLTAVRNRLQHAAALYQVLLLRRRHDEAPGDRRFAHNAPERVRG